MPLIEAFLLQFAVLKYLDLIGIVLFVGLPAFKVLVFLPTLRVISDIKTRQTLKAEEAKYARRILPLVFFYLLLLHGVILVHQIENMTGQPLARSLPILSHWLTGTFSGLLWLNKLFLLIFIGFLFRIETQRKDFLLLALGVLLCLGASLGGHAVTEKIHALVMTDWLHFTSVAVWVGALLPLRRMVKRYASCVKADQQILFLRKLIENFSLWAILAAAIIVTTGAFNAVIYLGADVFAFEAQYGKIFTLKLGFVLIVFGLGGFARFYILPRLQAEDTIERTQFLRLQRLFLRILSLELFFVTGVLIWAALLTQTPIPK